MKYSSGDREKWEMAGKKRESKTYRMKNISVAFTEAKPHEIKRENYTSN